MRSRSRRRSRASRPRCSPPAGCGTTASSIPRHPHRARHRAVGRAHAPVEGADRSACSGCEQRPTVDRSIRTLLVANRGEIAVRIIADRPASWASRTVARLRRPRPRAPHVARGRRGGRARWRRPRPSRTSTWPTRRCRPRATPAADAIHPGYGFLSENAAFAAAVIDAGLIWVGPTPRQIARMGDKIAAKRWPRSTACRCCPSVELAGDAPSTWRVPQARDRLPAAGQGGGRRRRPGHARRARRATSSPTPSIGGRREAAAAFGDGTVFVERYLERAPHIEIQVLGDATATSSTWRARVLDPAPPPEGGRGGAVARRRRRTRATRLGDGARSLWPGPVGYATPARSSSSSTPTTATFFFLEMNTRLQVEHPVTEAVTGLDLVELQLRIARGEPLPLDAGRGPHRRPRHRGAPVRRGPGDGWLPSTGQRRRGFGTARRRCAAMPACATGSRCRADYDSLLAKVIAHAPTAPRPLCGAGRALRPQSRSDSWTNRAMLVAPSRTTPSSPPVPSRRSFLEQHPEVAAARAPEGDDRVARSRGGRDDRHGAGVAGRPPLGVRPAGWRNLAVQGQRARWSDLDADEVRGRGLRRPFRRGPGPRSAAGRP